MHGKIGIQTGKTSNEMIFPGANCSFGGILTMIVGGHKLKFDVLRPHELF
jgi:hypothetical protein